MRILFVNTYDSPDISGGGAEATIHHLTRGLAEHGIEPIILGTAPEQGLQYSQRQNIGVWRAGIRNVYWPEPRIRRSAVRRMLWHALDVYNVPVQSHLKAVISAEKPDLVSFHNLPGWTSAAWATASDAGIPSIQVLHDAYLLCPKSTMRTSRGNCATQCFQCSCMRFPHRSLSNRISAVVGVSKYILDRHVGLGYFKRVLERRVIHNARDPAELGVSSSPVLSARSMPRFGFIGRLDSSKGVEVLLEAFERLNVDAELWVAGGGHPDYELSLRSRWYSSRIRFLGRVRPDEFYAHVDVVVVPSVWEEPLGMVVAEAFAFGKPVIASRRGGIPEMISDGQNGLLFDPDRVDELVIAMRRMCDSIDRERLASVASESAAPFMDRSRWVNSYVDLYERLLARGS